MQILYGTHLHTIASWLHNYDHDMHTHVYLVTVAIATVELSLLCQWPLVSAAHCGTAQPVSGPSISSASHHHGHQTPPPQLTPLRAFPLAHAPGRGFPSLLHKAGTASASIHEFAQFHFMDQCVNSSSCTTDNIVLTHSIMWVCLQFRRASTLLNAEASGGTTLCECMVALH